jgi:hypothetical protein
MDETEHLPWQQPNATEAFSAKCLAAVGPSLQQSYLAYPWASWIDRVSRGLSAANPPRAAQAPRGVRASVCQHPPT